MEGQCRLVKKHPRVSNCSVSDVVKQKSDFSTLGSQITNDFAWKSKAGNTLIQLKFFQATLSHNLSYKD